MTNVMKIVVHGRTTKYLFRFATGTARLRRALSLPPRRRARAAATAASAGLRLPEAATLLATASFPMCVPLFTGSGSARLSSLPDEVRGQLAKATTADGTMYPGS